MVDGVRLVRDGTLRFCTDFRELNCRAVQNCYQLPRIDEFMNALSESRTQKVCFGQVEMLEAHKERTTSSISSRGFWVCNNFINIKDSSTI